MFTIQKDLSGIFWHIYNNLKTKVNVSDFDIVIDSVASTFIIQCKNGSNIPSQAISISLIEVIDLSVGTSPIPFSGAAGLIQLLIAKNYTPYLQPTSSPVVVYRVGQVGVFTMTPTQFTNNFNSTGLGINTMIGWALRNGSNGTKNQQGKFSLNKGASPYDVIGNIGGYVDSIIVAHKHGQRSSSITNNDTKHVKVGFTGTDTGLYQQTPDSMATNKVQVTTEEVGTSGTGKNMPPYLIDVWVERVTELVINSGSGGGGGGGVQTVTGVNVTGTPTDRVVGVPTLQQVLTEDNQTGGENIVINNADAIELENGSLLQKGTYDFGGDGGISRICSVGFEDMWQAGIRHVYDNNGLIRNSTNGFDVIPDSSFDNTLRFKVNSLWTLDDGTTYKCTDASTGAAVWEIYNNFIPNLTQVLTVGDKAFDQVSGGYTFQLTDITKYLQVVATGTLTLDDSDALFPANSLLQFFVQSNGDINETVTLNFVDTNCFYLTENITTLTLNVGDFCELKNTNPGNGWVLNVWNKSSGGGGTVTSVGLTMPSAFTVTNSPITSSGDIAVTGAGAVSQYVRGDGTLANFPTSSGGGSSLSFYLNGSVSQGTFGGVAFREMDRTPILGAGTDFTINANGYIQSFITDAGVPNLLEIPAGNWNFETYFSASSGGASPSFYVELYKWNGTTLSLIASNSATPENITGGTSIDLYVSALAVPQTTLLATDRLAVRIYVTHSGRTIKLHTENSNLCQVITTFSTGLTALNGLTAQVQNLATGTSGTDFGINSTTATHTFNLPTASATNRGALSSTDWTTFNNKQNTATLIFDSIQKAIMRDNYFWFVPNTLSTGIAAGFGYSERLGGNTFTLSNNGTLLRGLIPFSSTATAGTIAFMRKNDAMILTGLEVVFTRKIQFNSNVSGQRFFCGISKGNQFSPPTNVEPSTLTDIVGVCQLSSSTNMHVVHNDASGTATTIDLGSSYPCTDSQYNYYITIEQTTTSYIVTVERVTVSTGASISTTNTLSTNIPNYATGTIQLLTWISNNATAAIASYLDGGAIGNVKNQ